MSKKLSAALVLLVIAGVRSPAQQFPPGYVDPAPLLAAAAEEIGEANLRCITFSGTGYAGAVGQTFENAVNIDWPRIDSLANYTRTINWETGDEQGDLRSQAWPEPRLMEVRPGLAGRHADAEGRASDAHRQWQIRLAHRRQRCARGRAARTGGALSAGPLAEPARIHQGRAPARRQSRRLLAVGAAREGPRRQRREPEKVHVVAITMLGKYRVDATINSQNQITGSRPR